MTLMYDVITVSPMETGLTSKHDRAVFHGSAMVDALRYGGYRLQVASPPGPGEGSRDLGRPLVM